jgi:hypothetical protein
MSRSSTTVKYNSLSLATVYQIPTCDCYKTTPSTSLLEGNILVSAKWEIMVYNIDASTSCQMTISPVISQTTDCSNLPYSCYGTTSYVYHSRLIAPCYHALLLFLLPPSSFFFFLAILYILVIKHEYMAMHDLVYRCSMVPISSSKLMSTLSMASTLAQIPSKLVNVDLIKNVLKDQVLVSLKCNCASDTEGYDCSQSIRSEIPGK